MSHLAAFCQLPASLRVLPSHSTYCHAHPTFLKSPQQHSPKTLSHRRRLHPIANARDKESNKGEMDIVERVYTAIFGAKQAEPFGLKRFDRDRFPELYPATLDEFADPVPADTPEMALFRPLLARTQLQTREIQLLYDANRDGWSADTFHEALNRKGASVVMASTAGAVFGGYNPKGFVGYGESRGSKAAFLFTWPDGDTSKPAVKLRKVGGAALAVVDEPETGPKFGADSLVVPLRPPRANWGESQKDRIAYSKLGSYYERRPDGGNTLFANGENPKGEVLQELKVFAGVYADGEEIPFDDALPFSLE
ncbi:unnamed protein product [Chondrus crispus]|uniref:TLDc domain-containing protein n=1 Tax=Chondrus crispus TaxID=2769 RepID=R7QPM3_CHOCR|nr:unnamed protein product [Chondrus crispus]CDF39345.1 unnamed protein product [Chondrus crispus]|eukprot:XP_005719256.1 unnamed protein product [Chondrus crispus]